MVLSPLVYACNDSYNPSDSNYASPLEVREITTDTVLTENTIGVQYNVHPNVTLDCTSVVLDGRVGSNMTAVIFAHPNSTILNPTVINARTGVSVVPNDHKVVWNQLENLSKADGLALVNASRNSGGQLITGGDFMGCRVAIYVHALNVGARIEDNKFNSNRLSIYLDAYSQQTTVDNNRFCDQGKGWKDKVLGWFAAGRESIAVDGSSNNIIINNDFQRSTRKAFIEIYKNCGENNIPRWEGSLDNEITDNSFEDGSIGVWVSSRRDDRGTPPCRPDDEGDIVINTALSNNTFSNVTADIRDHGTNTVIA